MSIVGRPTDHTCMESINGWIKAEIRCGFDTPRDRSSEEFASDDSDTIPMKGYYQS